MSMIDIAVLAAFIGLAVIAGRSLMRSRSLTHVEAPYIGCDSFDSSITSGDCGAGVDCSGSDCDCGGQ